MINAYLSTAAEPDARWRAQYLASGPTSNLDTDIAIKLGWRQDISMHMSWLDLKALHEFITRELEAHQCELDDLHGQALRAVDNELAAITVDLP